MVQGLGRRKQEARLKRIRVLGVPRRRLFSWLDLVSGLVFMCFFSGFYCFISVFLVFYLIAGAVGACFLYPDPPVLALAVTSLLGQRLLKGTKWCRSSGLAGRFAGSRCIALCWLDWVNMPRHMGILPGAYGAGRGLAC
jgi:hypothetical protein